MIWLVARLFNDRFRKTPQKDSKKKRLISKFKIGIETSLAKTCRTQKKKVYPTKPLNKNPAQIIRNYETTNKMFS